MSDILGRQTLTRHRFATSSIVNHQVVAGSETSTFFKGNVQPMDGEEMQTLGLSRRSQIAYAVFTDTTDLRAARDGRGGAEGIRADEVTYNGERYVVHSVEAFDSFAPTPHYEAVMVRDIP